MARRRIYLMRHGDVQYFVTDREPAALQSVELTERGREQARAAGRALRTVRFDRVITSGLDRVVETARIVLDASDHGDQPKIETWPEFEEFRVSHLADLAEHEVDAAFFTVFHSATPDRDMSYLFGENVGSLLDRVNIELDRLIADESWGTALVVLHGGVNRAILSRAITGTPVFLGRLEQTPGCINILDHGPDWFVRAVNVVPDNPAHVGPRESSLEEIADAYRAYRGYPVPGPR